MRIELAYLGKWVALEGDRVVASGIDVRSVRDEAKGAGIAVPFLTFVSPERHEHFVGGWID
jgi:hypothetical protein